MKKRKYRNPDRLHKRNVRGCDGSKAANDMTVWLLDVKQKAANAGTYDGF